MDINPENNGNDFGYPGECGNLADDPSYRSINFHGNYTGNKPKSNQQWPLSILLIQVKLHMDLRKHLHTDIGIIILERQYSTLGSWSFL